MFISLLTCYRELLAFNLKQLPNAQTSLSLMKDGSIDVRRLLRYIVTFQQKFLNNYEVETWIKLLFSSSSLFLVPSPRSERLEQAIHHSFNRAA